ncbi:MAG: GEVED domain-containing protein [Candidatus Nanopelagicales bacterium]
MAKSKTISSGLSIQIDMGDLPSIYPSLAISNGPSHILVAGLRLGSLEDIDTNGSPDSLATGDDELPVPGVSDDEDGIDFGTFQPGMPAVVTVTVQSNNASAVVYGFIDFNGDGDFSDVGERQQIATPSTGSYLLTFTVPTTATLFSPIGARFRLSSDSAAAQPTGAAINGEVEDYLIAVNTPLDFGDLPDPADGSGVLDYNTRLYDGGANHPMIPGLQMGAAIDAEEEGQPNSLAAGDDISPTVGTDDEDGVTFTEFNPGAQAALTVTAINTTGLAAILYAFVDFNNNGYLTDTGELLTVTVPGSTNVLTPFVLTYTVPTTATTYTPLGARFRLSTDSAMGPNGLATNGEVEDYLVQVVNRGNLVVRKQVIWGLNPSDPTRQFTVTVVGPSYPGGQSASVERRSAHYL